jgi:hypothetical protein
MNKGKGLISSELGYINKFQFRAFFIFNTFIVDSIKKGPTSNKGYRSGFTTETIFLATSISISTRISKRT